MLTCVVFSLHFLFTIQSFFNGNLQHLDNDSPDNYFYIS